MGLTHIVMVSMPHASAEEAHKLHDDFVALQQTSLKNGKPYIVSIRGGRQISIENETTWTHVRGVVYSANRQAFVVEFASASDRDFYVKECPVHQAFATSVGERKVTEVVVIDFIPGET